jgi:WD40 repeat protein
VPTQYEHAFSIAFSPDGTLFATAIDDILSFWELSSAREIWRLQRPEMSANAVTFRADGNVFALAMGNVIELWQIR